MIFEKYRPKEFGQIVGQDRAVAVMKAQLRNDRGAIWLEGNPGIGKTSLAECFINALGLDTLGKWAGCVREFNGVQFNADACRSIDDDLAYVPFGPARVILVNEASEMTSYARSWLMTRLEHLPARTWLIFTSMFPLMPRGVQDGLFEKTVSAALSSRLIRVQLTNQGLAPIFAAQAHRIAEAEGLNGKGIEEYVKLAKACQNNLREMLSQIEAGVMI